MTQPGFLITLTGGNGVGKDTIAPYLLERMISAGILTESLYGPGVNKATIALASLVKDRDMSPASHAAQALVWYAQHTETYEQVLVPKLESGTSIILNRGPESTLVFNVAARGLDKSHPELTSLYHSITSLASNHLTFLLDVPVEISLQRAAQQEPEKDQFQALDLTMHNTRRNLFLTYAKQYGWHVIDASAKPEEIADQIWSIVQLAHSSR